MKAPTDVEDDETMRALVTFVGEQIWGEICDWLNQWLALRFENSVAGALVRLLLEMLKAAHRSRAEGWSACQLTLTVMRRFDSLQPFRKRAFQFLRLAAVFIARQTLAQALWDGPQLLRSVVKRVASSGCLEPRLTRALVSFPKCFFGKLFAALLRLCQLRGRGCYLSPQMRDALVAQFLDDCATGVAGAWLLRLLPASGLRLTVDDGADTQGEPQLSTFDDVNSEPAQLTALLTPSGSCASVESRSLVALLLQLRAGDASKGIQAAASWRKNEDSRFRVAELIERSCNDGHWVLWGRGMSLKARTNTLASHTNPLTPRTLPTLANTPLCTGSDGQRCAAAAAAPRRRDWRHAAVRAVAASAAAAAPRRRGAARSRPAHARAVR